MLKACTMTRTVTHTSICLLLPRSGRFLHIHFDSDFEYMGVGDAGDARCKVHFRRQHYRNMHGPCKRLGYVGSVERV